MHKDQTLYCLPFIKSATIGCSNFWANYQNILTAYTGILFNSINVIIIVLKLERKYTNNSSDNYPLWMDLYCHHHFYFPRCSQKESQIIETCTLYFYLIWAGSSWSPIPSHSQNEAKLSACAFSVQIHQLQSSLLIQLRN